ncbi:MAG: hypothetical protein J2P31_20245, partial [Blastocatellia bacterium]|nr:hypothetical protein [Blastocatellia bacterium]
MLALLVSDDVIVTVILISLILLFWPVGYLIRHYLKERAARAPAPVSAKKRVEPMRPSRSYQDLESGAAETVDFLRRNRMGATTGGDPVYGLPWYLIAGPPASGKTSLMLSAGLSFSPLKSQRHADLDLLRPKNECQWRITDEAVFIDSAGRYQTEPVTATAGESGDDNRVDAVYSADRDEWLGLIDILKRYRNQRPLDGVVLTVSAASLLAMQSTAEVQQQARILRSRLNDLISSLSTKFPVYLVFTNIDAVQGFGEFFSLLEAEEREGVWGMMIPLAQKDRAHTLFDGEFARLIESLLTRRLQRINLAGAAREHLSVFDFPLQLNSARQKFGAFTNALFSPNPFSEQPLLRGIYFTSSASRGNASGTGRIKRMVEVGATAEVRIRSRGFFSEGFFKQVLRRDRHVAAAMQANYVRPGRVRRLAIAAASCGALSLALLIGMLVSYFNNQRLIGEAGGAGADLLRHFKPAAAGGAARLTEAETEDLG